MATTERDVLEAKVLPELQAIASSMGVQGYFRLRKADLIGAIIAKARGEEYTPTTPSATRSRRTASTAKSGSAASGSTAKEPARAAADASTQATPTTDRAAGDHAGSPAGTQGDAATSAPTPSQPDTEAGTQPADRTTAAEPTPAAEPATGSKAGRGAARSSNGTATTGDTPAAEPPPAPTQPATPAAEGQATGANATAAPTSAEPAGQQPGGQADARQEGQPDTSAAAEASTGAQASTGAEPSAAQGTIGGESSEGSASSTGEPSGGESSGADQARPAGEPADSQSETESGAGTRRRRRRTRGGTGDDDSGNSDQLQGILSAVTSGVTPVNRAADNGEAPAGAAETAGATTQPTPDASQSDGQSGQRDQGQSRDSGDRGQRRDWQQQQGGRWDGGPSQSSGGGGRRSRSRNRRNRNRFSGNDVAVADRPDYRDRSGVPDDRPEVARKGVLDIRSQDGYGFLRVNGYLPGPEDVYVPLSMIRRMGLRRGDEIEAQVKLPRDNSEKYAACSRVDRINGMEPDEARNRKDFKDLTPLYPEERLRLEHNPTEISTRIMDLMCPIGKGQRGLIVSPPKAGKTTVMKQIANAVSTNNPEVHLIILLTDERPEEVTDMQRSTKAEVVYSTFDRPSEDHCQISELTIERAKRLVEYGKDVMILLDGITRLSRAYNLATPASGKILSGGVDSSALYPPKRFFGAARNIEEGGSLTILATALVDTGSRMDEVIFEEFKGTGNMEVRLDRKMSERRIFPALDIDASSTRKEDLLLTPEELVVAWKLRRVLGALEPAQALEMVVDRMRASKTNAQFLQVIQRANMGN